MLKLGSLLLLMLASTQVPPRSAKKIKDAATRPPTELPSDLLTRVLWDEPNDQLERLSKISDAGEDVISRTFMSSAHRKAQTQIAAWMRRAGMRTTFDNIGNVHGRIEGRNKKAPATLIGSHYDTVYDAGKYDGTLGIIAGIAAVKATLIEAAIAKGMIDVNDVDPVSAAYVNLEELLDDDVGRLLEAPVEVVAFSDEEGVRFQTTFLGSSAVAGTLVSRGGLSAVDSQGKTVTEVLEDHNYPGTPESVEDVTMRKAKVAEYIEVHIEQGPVLETMGRPLGLVDGIAGQVRVFVSLTGQQGHAGTVPMKLRADPVAGAAQAMYEIEQACIGKNPDVPIDDSLVCTVGMLQLWPGTSNVIAGSANFTIDMRSRSNDVRSGLTKWVGSRIGRICEERKLQCEVQLRHEAPTVHCDRGVMDELRGAISRAEKMAGSMRSFQACVEGGGRKAACAEEVPIPLHKVAGSGGGSEESAGAMCTNTGNSEGGVDASNECKAGGLGSSADLDVPELVSGAGHDAMAMAAMTKIGMVFVRCGGGISHSPQESVDPGDIGAATASLFQYLRARVGAQARALPAPAPEA